MFDRYPKPLFAPKFIENLDYQLQQCYISPSTARSLKYQADLHYSTTSTPPRRPKQVQQNAPRKQTLKKRRRRKKKVIRNLTNIFNNMSI